MAELADKMREIKSEEPVVETAETTETPETTEQIEGSTEDDATGTAEGTTEEEPEALEPDKKPELFMSPAEEKIKAQKKEKGPAQKGKMPDSVRSKIEADTRTKVESEYGWAAGITKEEGQSLRGFRDLVDRNPIGAIDHLIKGVSASPVLRSQLIAYLNDLYTPAAKAEVKADPMPAPDTEQGYSVEGLKKLNAWQQAQILAKVDERVAPLMSDRKTAADRADAAAKGAAYATRSIGAVASRKGFAENKAAIQVAYNAFPRPWSGTANEENHPQYRSEAELLQEAYYTVTATKNSEAAQKKWAAEQKAKAAVTGVVRPGAGSGTGTTSQKKPKTFKDFFIANADKFKDKS